MESRLEIEQLQQQWDKNCCFCGRFNSEVMVICEGRCLICRVCMKAPNIRQLLVLTAEEATIRNARKRCPICDNPLARNTVISVQTFDSRTLCDGISLQAGFKPVVNPLLFYYKRIGIDIVLDTECNSILQDQPSWKTLMQKCSNLLVAMEGAPQGRITPQLMMDYIADVYCALWDRHRRGYASLNEPLYEILLSGDFSQKKKKKRLGTSAAAAAADAVVATNALVMSVVSSRNVNLDAISESINQGSVASYAMQGAINNVTGDGRKSREGGRSTPTAGAASGGLDAAGSSYVSSSSNPQANTENSSVNHLLNSIDGSAANDVSFLFSIQQGHFNGTRVCKIKPALEILVQYLHVFMGNSTSNLETALKKNAKQGGAKQAIAMIKSASGMPRLPSGSTPGGGLMMRNRSNTAISTFSGNSGANQNSISGSSGNGEKRTSFAASSDLVSASNSLATSSGPVINAPPVNPLMIAEANCRFYHFALYARILGIFPVPIAIDRPAVCNIATTILVHATHPKVSLKDADDGRAVLFADGTNPQPKDIQDVLLAAITGTASSAVTRFGCVSTKRAITLLESLAPGSVDPLWAMLPYQSQCAELGTTGPWSAKSISKLLLVVLLRSSAPSPGGMGASVCYCGRRGGDGGDVGSDMRGGSGSAQDVSMTGVGQASESSPDGGGSKSRTAMIIAMHETLSHLTELWTGAPLQYTRKATTHELILKNARNPRAVPKQSVLSSSSSNDAMTALHGNDVNAILQKRRHLKETLLSMLSVKSNIVHQLVDVEKLQRGFSDWSEIIKPIDFKTARAISGLCVIDVALFAYICVEAWVLEVGCVESRISEMHNVSNRKLAMTLSSFDPSHCRELSVSEKMCMVDIINRFIKDQKERLQFYTKSKKIDCFEAVEYVCRNVDWFEMKRAQRLRIEALESNTKGNHGSDALPHVDDKGGSSRPSTRDGIEQAVSKSNDVSGADHAQKPGSAAAADGAPQAGLPNVPLPADSAVLRSLLEMTDVALTHYTVELGKSFIKRDIWASLMSEATGWRDVFNWVPTIMTGVGAKEVAILRDNKVSAKQAVAYYEYSRRFDEKYIRSRNIEEDAAAGEKRFILGAEEVEYDCTDSEDERESEAQKQREHRRVNNMRRNRQRVVRPAVGASLGVVAPGAAPEAVDGEADPAMSFPGLDNCPKPSLEGLGLVRQQTPEYVRRAQSLQDGIVRRPVAAASGGAHYRSRDDGDAGEVDEPMYLMDPYILDVVRNWVMWSSKTFEPVQFIKRLNAWVAGKASSMQSRASIAKEEGAGSEEDESLKRDEHAVAAYAATLRPHTPKQTSTLRLIPFDSPANAHLPLSVGRVYEPNIVVQLSSISEAHSEKEIALSQLKKNLPSVSQSVSVQRSKKRAANNASNSRAERSMSISQGSRIPRSPVNIKMEPVDLDSLDISQDDRSDGDASDAGDEDDGTSARKYVKYSSKKLERSIIAALGADGARKYLGQEDATSSKALKRKKGKADSSSRDNISKNVRPESGHGTARDRTVSDPDSDNDNDEARDTFAPAPQLASRANASASSAVANLTFPEATAEESVAPTVVNNVLFRNVIDPYTGLPMRHALTYNRTASSAYGYIDILSNDTTVLSTVRALAPLKSSMDGDDEERAKVTAVVPSSRVVGVTQLVSTADNTQLQIATTVSTPSGKVGGGSVSIDERITRKPFDGTSLNSIGPEASTFSIDSSIAFSDSRSQARLGGPVLAAMQRLTVGAEETFDPATTVAGGVHSDTISHVGLANNSQRLQVPKQLLGEDGEDDGTAAVMFRPQAPNRVYDRRAVDLGHYSRLRPSEMPHSAGQALRALVPTISSDGSDSLYAQQRHGALNASISKGSLTLANALGVSTLGEEGIEVLKLRESKIKYQELKGLFERYFGELVFAEVSHDGYSLDGDASRSSYRHMDRETDGDSVTLGAGDEGSSVKSGGLASLRSGSYGAKSSAATSLSPGRAAPQATVVTASPQQIAAMRRLRVLDLHGSTLDRRSVELLCHYLSIGCNLEELYLGATACTETAAARILNAINNGKGEQHLVKLDLRDNEILINSAPFNSALQRMKGIKLLNLSSNRFHAQSEIAKKSLVTCIRGMDVAVLSLARMRLTDAGAGHLLSRLAGHRSLRVLDLANTLVTSACEAQIVTFLKSTPQLRCLLLHGLIMADTATRKRLEAAAATASASSSSSSVGNSSGSYSPSTRGRGPADGNSKERSLEGKKEDEKGEGARRRLILEGRYDGIDLTY